MKMRDANLARALMLAAFLTMFSPQARAQAVSTPSAPAVHGAAMDASPAPPAAPAAKSEAIQTTKIGGQEYLNVSFQWLASYSFDAPDNKVTNDTQIAQVEKQIPAAIKALDGKRVFEDRLRQVEAYAVVLQIGFGLAELRGHHVV